MSDGRHGRCWDVSACEGNRRATFQVAQHTQNSRIFEYLAKSMLSCLMYRACRLVFVVAPQTRSLQQAPWLAELPRGACFAGGGRDHGCDRRAHQELPHRNFAIRCRGGSRGGDGCRGERGLGGLEVHRFCVICHVLLYLQKAVLPAANATNSYKPRLPHSKTRCCSSVRALE